MWIADLGYFALVRLAQMNKAGVYLSFAVEGWGGDLAGKQVDILEVLQGHAEQEEQEYEIVLGAGKQVPCRLFARRATAAQIKRRHEAQDEYARKHGTQVMQLPRSTTIGLAIASLLAAFCCSFSILAIFLARARIINAITIIKAIVRKSMVLTFIIDHDYSDKNHPVF